MAGGRRRRARFAARRRPPRPASPRDSHDRPGGGEGPRRRALGRRRPRVRAHRRRLGARARRIRSGRRGRPARHVRLPPRAGRPDAPRRALVRPLQPPGRRGPAGRQPCARPGARGLGAPHADSKRPHAHLPRGPGGPGRGWRARWSRGRTAPGWPISRTASASGGWRAGRSRSRRARSRSRSGRHDRRPRQGAHAGARADRGAHDPRQPQGRRADRGAPAAGAPPRARAARCGLDRGPARAAGGARRADPARTGSPRRARDGPVRRPLERRRHALCRARGEGRRGVAGDDAAGRPEGTLRPGAARPQRARRPPLLPLHLAHPPVSGSRLPPRAPRCAGPRRRRAAERGPGGSRHALLRGGARRRAPRAPRHRDLPGVPARAPAVRPGLGRAVRGRGGRPDRGRSIRPLRRGVRGVHARAALAGRAGDARPARREHGGAERAAAPARETA